MSGGVPNETAPLGDVAERGDVRSGAGRAVSRGDRQSWRTSVTSNAPLLCLVP